jgi:hypothetical protein
LYRTNQRLRQPHELSAWGRESKKARKSAPSLQADCGISDKTTEKAYLLEQPTRLDFHFFVPAREQIQERVRIRIKIVAAGLRSRALCLCLCLRVCACVLARSFVCVYVYVCVDVRARRCGSIGAWMNSYFAHRAPGIEASIQRAYM